MSVGAFIREYLGKCITYLGPNAERLPEPYDEAIDEILSSSYVIFEAGYIYPVEGEEVVQILFLPPSEELGIDRHYWVVVFGGGAPGSESATLCVFSTLREAIEEARRDLEALLEEVTERMREARAEGDRETYRHYREQRAELEEALRRLKRLLF